MSCNKRVGTQTVELKNRPKLIAATSVVGPKEAEGPLGDYFDIKLKDDKNGKDTYEKAESSILYTSITESIKKANLSEEQIVMLLNNIGDTQQKIVTTFDSMSEEERKAHSDMVTQCELLEFKFYSLKDFLWFKQGHISMKLPEGIDYPDGYSQEKDILKLIKTVFNKKEK